MKFLPRLGLFLLFVLFVSSFNPSVFAQSAFSNQSRNLALVGAKIYPSPTEKPIMDGVVLIENGKIKAVGENGKIKIPPDTKILDCQGLTLTAGFWNSHVHFTEPKLMNPSLSSSELTEHFQQMLTRFGFTTVFDTGSSIEITKKIRGRIASGEVSGPRILTAGEPLYPKDGVPIYLSDLKIKLPEVDSAEQAVLLVKEKIENGADGVKIFAGSWLGGDKVATMPLEIVKAITAETHRRGKLVLAHPQSLEGLQTAVDGGVDVLVHTAPDSGTWNKDLISKMKRRNVALIPTLKLWRFELEKEKLPAEVIRKFQNAGVEQLRAYAGAGGQILFGTDVGYMTDYDTAEEFLLMSQAKMDFRQILASLTTAPAKRFGASGKTGKIARGMDADIVLLAGDPATDVKNLSSVKYTIRQGKIIYQSL